MARRGAIAGDVIQVSRNAMALRLGNTRPGACERILTASVPNPKFGYTLQRH